MNKEAVNTFQEGLNYDLNPITTPNNVLTDCVNGTFITLCLEIQTLWSCPIDDYGWEGFADHRSGNSKY